MERKWVNKILTDNEEKFMNKAESLGYEIEEYSGRGMFGKICPSVIVDNPMDFIAEIGMKGLFVDNIGLKYVVYIG